MEVIVADSSDDGSHFWIEEHYPRARVRHSDERLLPGAARNLGARLSKGRLLAFLDADAWARPNWLSVLHAKLKQEDGIRLIAAAVANANPDSEASRALYRIEFSEYFPGQPSGFRPNLSSCNLLIRREDYFRIGGFDSQAAMSEDSMFCRALGRGLYLETSTEVLHRHREDWPEVCRHLIRLGYWGGRFRLSHPSPGHGLRRIPALSAALLPLRLWRISRRMLKCDEASVLQLPGEFPALARGLACWTKGFHRGIRGAEEDPVDDHTAPRRPS